MSTGCYNMTGSPKSLKYRQNLRSLSTHLRKFEKPTRCGYDEYATTYLTSDIPWSRILPDETDSITSELPPFTPTFRIEQYSEEEKERKLRGESVRKKELFQHPEQIIQHFQDAKISNREEHLAYLYFKSMQFAEVNKALALDEKYPKPDPCAIRSTYSHEHQAAVAAVLRENSLKSKLLTEAPLQLAEGQFVEQPNTLTASNVATKRELEDLIKLWQVVSQTVGRPPLIKHFLKADEEPWQFKAKPGRPRVQPQAKHKFPWKKNIYPPKSAEERIAELRKMAAPLEPEYLQTDQLPFVWEPELMIQTFCTAAMEAQQKDDDVIESKEDWWKKYQTNKRCTEWLKSIPDSF